jgi:hypothetical protein
VFAINNKYIKSKDDFEQIIKESKGGGVLLQGRYENSNGIQYYAFGY